MRSKMIFRLLMAVTASLFLVAGAMAQDKKTDSPKTNPQTPPDTTATPGTPTTTQISGVISSVNRHDGTSLFEIKIKDASGKKHEVSVSPSAVIKQGDQKVAATTLQKGANVQIDAYTTPSGSATAKTITIATTSASSKQ